MPGTLRQEIEEHPAALMDLVTCYRQQQGRGWLHAWRARAENAKRIVFTGMGTSEFVAESILPQLAEQGLDASVIDAGELLHYPRAISGLLVLISQSGESAETKQLALRLDPSRWIALTNDPQSTIARHAELNLPMHAGPESAIATKTYANTLALLFLMSQLPEDLDSALAQLERLAGLTITPGNAGLPAGDIGLPVRPMSQVPPEPIERASSLLADASFLHFISRGPAMAAAKQAALTFMEGARISCTPFTGGAFRHGPYELVDASHRCLFFIPGGNTFALLQKIAAEVAGKGSRVVIITDQEFVPMSDSTVILRVPCHDEPLFSLAAAPTQERLLEALARRRGITAGIFRNSRKIIAIE